jgi:DNA mismatch endonuclease (patch repair protein)
MRANRRKDTAPERAVRSHLHARGLRFRVDLPIVADGGRVLRPDVVFTGRRLALYIDGCYWHGCPKHGTTPVTNRAYWQSKIEENKRRDAEQTRRLQRAGWTVLRVWEHEDPVIVAENILRLFREQAAVSSPSPRR